jgi:hypothetical protein
MFVSDIMAKDPVDLSPPPTPPVLLVNPIVILVVAVVAFFNSYAVLFRELYITLVHIKSSPTFASSAVTGLDLRRSNDCFE